MATLPLFSPVADALGAVEARIRERLVSDVPLVRQVAEYLVSGGGKRLRPALVLLSAESCGARGSAPVDLATVVEFIHTATLLHDDVVDASTLRRGRSTANAAFGNAASVLVGDFLYSRAFQMMVAVDNMRVMRVLADATNTIAEGEVLQLMNCNDPDVSEKRYLDVVRRKTAALFEASARLGAILAEAPMPVESALAEYGAHLGTAFQLVDDLLDYSGDETDIGKNLGDDLAEGKPTLPLILTMRDGAPAQAACVREAIASGGRERFHEVLAAVRASGALVQSRQIAGAQARAAAAALDPLPASIAKTSLLELAAFSVDRKQ